MSADNTLRVIERKKIANRVVFTGAIFNFALSGLKLIAGILGNSQAMVADAIHSLSDLGTDLAVVLGMHFSSKPIDKGHPYGHGKIENLATIIIAVTLLSVGVGIGYNGVLKIIEVAQGGAITSPSLVALIAAIFSILFKEFLFRYTLKHGQRINSSSLIANAYHHRSDAYSSLGTGLGIAGAMALGSEWAILDPIAAVIVAILIVKEGLSIGLKSINDLLEASLSAEEQEKVLQIAHSTPGVKMPHNLRCRKIGSIIALDIHIRVAENLSIREGHSIAHDFENQLKVEFGKDLICYIHIEPFEEDLYENSKKN